MNYDRGVIMIGFKEIELMKIFEDYLLVNDDDSDYLRDEHGNFKAVRDDAPDNVKEAFRKFKEVLDKAREKGIKL
jgi:hypothetical protein